MTQLNSPPDDIRPPDGTALFQALAGLALYAINFVGVFWALLVKKPGTVGSRAYTTDFFGGFLLIVALSNNDWYPDKYLFFAAMVLMALKLVQHRYATSKRKEHVHTRCIGQSRFPGKGHTPLAWEVIVGGLVAIICFLVGLIPFGTYIGLSAICASLNEGLIEERDRQRAIQMADAMLEQEYAMENFRRWQDAKKQ